MDDRVCPFFSFSSRGTEDGRHGSRGHRLPRNEKAGGGISCTRDSKQKIKTPPERELGRDFDYIRRENMDKKTEFMTKDWAHPLSSRVVTGEIYHCFTNASSFFSK